MGLFKNFFKKKGVVEYERPISYFLNSDEEMFFKGKDFYEFLLEYQNVLKQRGLTPDNNDGAQIIKMFIKNFKIFSDGKKLN